MGEEGGYVAEVVTFVSESEEIHVIVSVAVVDFESAVLVAAVPGVVDGAGDVGEAAVSFADAGQRHHPLRALLHAIKQ